jgi:ribokinase
LRKILAMSISESIVVIGSSNTDMVIVTDHFPMPGETVLGGKFLMNPGGKGANQAVAAARLGGRVSFIAKVGRDVFGQQAINSMMNEGIDVSMVAVDPTNPSGVAQITVDSVAENCIVVAPGANMTLGKADIDNASLQIDSAGVVLLQLEIPIDTVVYAIHKAHRAGKRVILNPAPAAALPDDLFKSIHIITPNETETELLTGIRVKDEITAEEASAVLRAKGVDTVIVTMGEKGAYVSSGGKTLLVPAARVRAVDSTAAGDTFNGALAAALARGDEIFSAVKFANNAAAIAVTRMGAQSSIPTQRELDIFLAESKG